MRTFLVFLMMLVPTMARASSDVALESNVFVEKIVKDERGRNKAVLEAPKLVLPGDRLVFILKYHNQGKEAAHNFVVTNPLPSVVQFQGAGDANAQVSVNGGRNWGRLDALKVRERDGSVRSARLEDVTHVRWPMVSPIPAGSTGRLSFRGIVR